MVISFDQRPPLHTRMLTLSRPTPPLHFAPIVATWQLLSATVATASATAILVPRPTRLMGIALPGVVRRAAEPQRGAHDPAPPRPTACRPHGPGGSTDPGSVNAGSERKYE